jgi:hypothetical protein
MFFADSYHDRDNGLSQSDSLALIMSVRLPCDVMKSMFLTRAFRLRVIFRDNETREMLKIITTGDQ